MYKYSFAASDGLNLIRSAADRGLSVGQASLVVEVYFAMLN